MQPDISEYSYGFALVSELIHYYEIGSLGAPRFPTQVEEGEEGGYDVEIPHGIPIFLQMKRSECLVGRTAKNASRLGIPHYRMHLRPLRHSQQHNLLLAWEQLHPEVYYATPLFHTSKELDEAYQSNEVAARSLLVKPSIIGHLPDDKNHHLDVSANGAKWLFCSGSPRELEAVPVERVLRTDIPNAVRARKVKIDDEYLTSLGDEILEICVRSQANVKDERDSDDDLGVDFEGDVRRKVSEVRAERKPVDYVREVAIALMGCELLFACDSS